MARLTICDGGVARSVPLGSVNLVGRHWTCNLRLTSPQVPLHWLEIRWREGRWSWRALARADDTRGTGEVLAEEWRALAAPAGRIRLDERTFVRLDAADGPVVHAVDLISGEALVAEALDDVAEVGADGVFALGADEGPRQRLEDGDIFLHAGRAYRLVGESHAGDTARPCVTVRHPRLRCDVDGDALEAIFSVDGRRAAVRGPCLRILAVYAEARLHDDADGGWRSAEDIRAAWIARGGQAQSHPDRVGWEKGRLRAAISRTGVVEATGLFETRRRDGIVLTRLVLPPERLFLAGASD